MAVFTPPTVNDVSPIYLGPGKKTGVDHPAHYRDSTPAMQTLMSRYAMRPRGVNVYLMADGSVTEVEPPQWNPQDPSGPVNQGYNPFTHQVDATYLPSSQQVVKVFWGATDNPVTAEEVTILTEAGYGPYIH